MTGLSAKAEGALKRLLLGNGVSADELTIEVLEARALAITGKLALTPVLAVESRMAQSSDRRAEAHASKAEAEQALAAYQAELRQNAPWTDSLKTLLKDEKHHGWGLAPRTWPLPQFERRYAVTTTCPDCRGQKTKACPGCYGSGKMPCHTCRIQWAGQMPGQIQCPDCFGSARNPNNPQQPCLRCTRFTSTLPGFIPCPDCEYMPIHDRGFQQCRPCKGQGQLPCAACHGKGKAIEELTLKTGLQGNFSMQDLHHIPPDVFPLLDALSPAALANGHAVVTPDAADVKTGLAFIATLPYARLRLALPGAEHEISAVGLRPLLANMPPLLDERLRAPLQELTPDNMAQMAQRYRLFGELAAALANGQKSRDFFSRTYPYGVSAEFAKAATLKIRHVFSRVTIRPRLLAGAAALLLALSGWAAWRHFEPGANFSGQREVWDGVCAVALAALVWFAVDFAARRSLKKLVRGAPIATSPGGLIAIAFTIAFMAGAAGVYWLL